MCSGCSASVESCARWLSGVGFVSLKKQNEQVAGFEYEELQRRKDAKSVVLGGSLLSLNTPFRSATNA